MKKNIFIPLILFLATTFTIFAGPISYASAYSLAEDTHKDIPYTPWEYQQWPKKHTESCWLYNPQRTVYETEVNARITDDKKIEYVLTTIINSVVIREEYTKMSEVPIFSLEFIFVHFQIKNKRVGGWLRFNLMLSNEDIDLLQDALETIKTEYGVSKEDYDRVCKTKIETGFQKFWKELFKEAGIDYR